MSSPTYTSIKASSLRSDIARQAFSSPPRVPYSSGASVYGPSRKRPYSSALCDFQNIPVQQSVSPHSSDRHLGPNARTYLPVIPPLRRPRKLTPPRNSSPDCSLLTRLPERDPYDLLSSPEANWSTLPAKKKANSSKRPGQSSNATSAKFRLPLATSTVAAAEPEAKRRRVSYLPPPPPPPQKFAYRKTPSTDADNKEPTSWKVTKVLPGQIPDNLAREGRSAASLTLRARPSQQHGPSVNQVTRHSMNQMGRAYPSPPHRRSSPPSESLPPMSPALATQILPMVFESPGSASIGASSRHMRSRNSLPSPPRSDSPSDLSSDIGQQVRLPFSTRTLEDRYPKMRKAVAEVCFGRLRHIADFIVSVIQYAS